MSERVHRLRVALAEWAGPSDRAPSAALRRLAVAAAVGVYAIIVMGGVVRTTGSGLGCDAPNDNGWPLCQGRLLPPLQQQALIEFSHRWLAVISGTLLVALIALAWLRYRHLRRFAWGMAALLALFVVQAVLGAVTVQYRLSGDIVMAHLANAELLLGVLVFTVLQLFTPPATLRGGGERQRAVSRAALVAAAGAYVLVLSGAFVVARGAGDSCSAWPLCGSGVSLSGGQLVAYNIGHRVIAGAVTVLVALAVMGAVRAHRGSPAVRWAARVVAAVLLAQIVAGAVLVETRLPAATRSLHEALASLFWASSILFALLVTPGAMTDAAPRAAAPLGAARPPRRPVPEAVAS